MGEKANGNRNGNGTTAGQAGKGQGSATGNRAGTGATQTPSTPSGSGAASNRTGTQAQELSGPHLVSIPVPGEQEAPKTKNRPSGLTYNKSGNKNGNKTKKSTSEAGAEMSLLVMSLVQGLFSIAASRLGPHWQLKEDEANNIATPAANILAKYMDSDAMSEHTDVTLLIIALGVAVIPRAMIQTTIKKEGKKDGPRPAIPTDNNRSGAPAGSSAEHRGANPGQPRRDSGANDASSIKQLLEPISAVGF